jgi:pantothenate kinase-related protein Tda10
MSGDDHKMKKVAKLLTQTIKLTATCLIHSGWVPGLYPDSASLLTAFTRSATPANFIDGPSGVIGS